MFPFYRGTRPDANINNAIEVADIVDSTYNALVLQVNKRFNKGLLFNANYTLSKARGHGPELDDVHFELRDDGRSVQQRR